MPTTKKRLPRNVARVCLSLAGGVIGLLIGEAAVRLLRAAPEIKPIALNSEDCVYRRSTNPVLGFELKPDYRNDNPDFIESYERTNAHGLRDKERTVEKKPGTRRVLLLGDSVVEGHGLAEADTISRQWETLYPDQSTEILNFGVSAYCTLGEVELLETKGLAFDPDVVVVVFVENDFDNFNREAFALEEAAPRPAMVNGLFRSSHLFRLMAIRFNLFHFGAEADPVRWNKDAIGDNNVVDGFARLRKLADREGFKVLVAIWPRFKDDGIADIPPVSERDPEPLVEQLAAIHGLPSARLSEAFARHATTGGVENPRLTYSSGDGLHPSPQGASVAAAALNDYIGALESGKLVAQDAGGSDQSVVTKAQSLGAAVPDYSRVYHTEGVRFLKAGELDKAVGQFQKALAENPNHAGAHGNMGLAYEKLGKPKDAKAHYEKAIALQDDFIQGHYNLARLTLVEGNVAGAVASLRCVLEIDPDHTDALNFLGMELGKAGQFAEARGHLERAVRLEPDFSEAHNNLGTVYAATGQLEKAIAQFKQAVQVDPSNEGAKSRLAQVERMLREGQ